MDLPHMAKKCLRLSVEASIWSKNSQIYIESQAVDGFVEVASKLCRHYNGPHDIAQGSFTLAVQKSHENVREMALVSTAPG